MTGEVDSIENIPIEQVAALQRNKNIVVAVHNKSGTQGFLRPNHLYPPFNDPKATGSPRAHGQPGRLHARRDRRSRLLAGVLGVAD